MLCTVVVGAACGGGATVDRTATTVRTTADALPAGTIVVFAASSLTDAFTAERTAFEAIHRGVKIEFNFGGSPTLRTQLEGGARADVYASADQANMRAALDKSLVRDAGTIFVRNRLAIIVPASNPGRIAAPIDLAKPGLKLVLTGKDVPAGKYARDAFAKMEADAAFGAGFSNKVLANLVSEEANVKAVVAKVQLGEADAGIVYVTDVTAAISKDVTIVAIPDAYNVIATYPIAVTKDAEHADAALAFIDFVTSDAGQQILVTAGFLPAKRGARRD
jgi:molybdate transport system substrate-binding protein